MTRLLRVADRPTNRRVMASGCGAVLRNFKLACWLVTFFSLHASDAAAYRIQIGLCVISGLECCRRRSIHAGLQYFVRCFSVQWRSVSIHRCACVAAFFRTLSIHDVDRGVLRTDDVGGTCRPSYTPR